MIDLTITTKYCRGNSTTFPNRRNKFRSGHCPQRLASVVLVKGVFVLVHGVLGLRSSFLGLCFSNTLIERSEGWSLPSVGVWTSRKKMPFFSPKFKSAAIFSAPAHEGNLFFLSGRSARKKIHNFAIKSSHLCRTSRQVWLSCSACDHCRAYQGFQFQMQISC